MSAREAWPDTLPEIRSRALDLLEIGARDRRSGFHTVQVATIGLDGAPKARTTVLRGFDPEARELRVHTDRRSVKVAEIARDPRVSLHFYDPVTAVQLRLDAVARVETDSPAADAAWAAAQAKSRVCYRLDRAPGESIDTPDDGYPRRDATDPGDGRAAFAILLATVSRLEWLWLNHAGHRRAAFDLATGEASWLVP